MKMYTVDIFDTLVARSLYNQTLLIEELGERVDFLYGIKKDTFVRERLNAEQSRDYLTNEPTLDDFYNTVKDKLHLDEERTSQIKNLEISIEIETAIPITGNVKIVNKMIERGLLACFLTDMHLPSEVIHEILVKCNINTSGIPILTSSEIKLSKRKGDIYPYVRKKYGLNDQWTHIGDNFKSDVVNAKKNDVKALHVPFLPDISISEIKWLHQNTPVLTKCWFEWYLSKSNNIRRAASDKFIVFLTILLIGFTIRLKDLSAKHYYFIARDCYYISKIWNHFHPSVSFDYVKFSRSFIKWGKDNESLYQEYIWKKFDKKGVFVDVGWTGKSFQELSIITKNKLDIFLMQSYFESSDCMIKPKELLLPQEFLESILQAPHGTLTGLNHTDGQIKEILSDIYMSNPIGTRLVNMIENIKLNEEVLSEVSSLEKLDFIYAGKRLFYFPGKYTAKLFVKRVHTNEGEGGGRFALVEEKGIWSLLKNLFITRNGWGPGSIDISIKNRRLAYAMQRLYLTFAIIRSWRR